ncbi:putative calpain-like cysteine peptidase putative cysteine peptidase Clan CA family C2 [Leptomonas seymouri]|uniref:Putative calpain-like cysteine peptidase putative cysteine peptidase Clan CA family C2 n=1 Tax=Leptomonas seymouri TaxID=5684 RepID=A0A0N1HZW3_LEPSE|nr:putative calpain-like cysteine peptidase putative cysteine peptidase Clan CA family C2 [Leptomonas seymouri]|eukprot:KPI83073.1 putative calpain-like cysteine peptidase putative cysteine peptidase Clan CA family C2 [Leptomonas seymouri]
MLPDELEVVEEDSENAKVARIDYFPFKTPASDVREVPDSGVPFEDRAFMLDNRDLTPQPWVHIGDLYPEGKTKPLLPDVLSRDQFEQGTAPECCCLTGFATLVERHPDVIRNCFISKKPRRDGRYTFQFHRYGQWVKVEIDDRIPKLNNDPLFCRSPTHHWWPLLLEKAYAKFYTLYDHLEGCSLAEVYHDFSGCPVINVPLDLTTARSVGFDVASPAFWLQLRNELPNTAMSAQSSDEAGCLGVISQQFYGVLDILPTTAQPQTIADIVIQLHNPYTENTYSGPMANKGDRRWSMPQLQSYQPSRNTIYVPADAFIANFFTLSQAHLRGLMEPCWNFNSEWGEGTNGGNPSLLTWRENPLYVVRNDSDEPVEIVGMIRQPDKRHHFHLLAELNYVCCDLLLAQSTENSSIPTYLVTHNNHRIVHKGVFLNYREVTNFISIPANSLCYLVPTAMYHEKSIFMLSYWYKQPADARAVNITRLKTSVARDLPAVRHVTMRAGGKERVDFLVDLSTDAHILLSQWNHDAKGGNDVRTDNYVGMYLYDDASQQVARVSSASNLKEIGLVTHLPAAGHYVLSLTCPVAKSEEVQCRVEVVCVERARVRVTDAYENAPSFDDLAEEPPVQAENMDGVMYPHRYIYSVEPVVAAKPAVTTVQNSANMASAKAVAEEVEEGSKTPNLSFLNSFYEGVPKDDILLMENPTFAQMAQERETLKGRSSMNASRIHGLEKAMHNLATQMADAMHKRERVFLDPQPERVPLELLRLNDDEPFTTLEHALRMAMKDSARSRDDIVALQEKLIARTAEMARELKNGERERFLNPVILGIPVSDLPLDEDPQFHELEVERLRERAKDAPDAAKIRRMEEAMNERAEDLAQQKLAQNRGYLEPEHLHVANNELQLDTNREFVLREAARQEQIGSPRPNSRVIAALEDELNGMAVQMAADFLAEQRPSYLAPDHNGRLIDELPLNSDDQFLQLERDRRELLKKPTPCMNKVADIEDELNARADEMAKEMNRAERPRYMKSSYYGKRTEELPLNDDAQVAVWEAQRARLRRDPSRNAAAIRAVEEEIHARAAELAKKMVDQDRKTRYGAPGGIPVELLDLDGDSTMRRLEAEHMDLLNMAKQDPRAIAASEAKLYAHAEKLAKEFLKSLRLDITGDRSDSPSLMSDAPYLDMENKLIALMSEDPEGKKDQIADLKEALAKRNAELKRQRVVALRSFLEPKPFGIQIEELNLDGDAPFLQKETQLTAAMADNAPPETIKAIHDEMHHRVNILAAHELARRYPFLDTQPANVPLENLPIIGKDLPLWEALNAAEDAKLHHGPQLQALQNTANQRLREIAEAHKWAERTQYLDERPHNIHLRALPLDENADFVEKEIERNRLLSANSPGNTKRIAELEHQLQQRAYEIADELKWADREGLLGKDVSGVPLHDVPLDEHVAYLAMEDEWRDLKLDPKRNAAAIAGLEKRMKERARQLADDKKWADREGLLGRSVEDMPLRDIGLDSDPAYVAMEDELRKLRHDPGRNARRISDLEKSMRDRAHELARKAKEEERYKFLPRLVDGFEHAALALDGDKPFRDMEAQRRKLVAEDPRGNAASIAQLEDALRARAQELAAAKKDADREAFLDPKPEEVKLRYVPLDDDAEFIAMEGEWRKLMQDPRANARRIAELEKAMNERAHGLADARKWADRNALLDPKPEGVKLAHVPLDGDAVFLAAEEEWRDLMQDPRANARRLAELEKAMKERARKLAGEMKWADREGLLGKDVSGVPLHDVPLDGDAAYLAMEDEWRDLKLDPKRNAAAIAGLEKRMKERAAELVVRMKDSERIMVLGQYVGGVAVPEIDLDADAVFCALEVDRRRLMLEPAKRTSAVAAVEGAMRKRAAEIVAASESFCRDDVLDPKPEGVYLRHCALDADAGFMRLEAEWRQLMQEPKLNARRIAEQEKAMNGRAHELAKERKWSDRDRIVDPTLVGVPIRDLALDDDRVFCAFEEEWRELMLEPNRNARRIAELEKSMNDRVRELCREEEKKFEALPFREAGDIPVSLLPLETDAVFQDLADMHARMIRDPHVVAAKLRKLEKDMRDRAEALANLRKAADRRRVCGAEMEEMSEGGAELDRDEMFLALERERYHLEAADAVGNRDRISSLEEAMRQRARELAKPRLHSEYRGIPVEKLNEFSGDELLRKNPGGNRRGRSPKGEMVPIDPKLDEKARKLAEKMVEQESYPFLGDKVHGVSIKRIPFRKDQAFMDLADERRRAMYCPEKYPPGYKEELEEAMRRRVGELADEYSCDHPVRTPPAEKDGQTKKPTRATAKSSEAPEEGSSGSRRLRDKKVIREVEERTEEHRLETVEEAAPFIDPSFHSVNKQLADLWPRIADIYPDGVHQPLIPDHPKTADVASPAGDLTYLAPFLAALSRQPPLLHRLFQTKTHPVRAPYSFVFFDPNSSPVTVEIDDRIPCDETGVPRFTVSPTGAWWPLLLEKAYAKYVGGYERFDDCTSHETLRDLTGRPVTHLPFDMKLASEVANCSYRDVAFWRRTHDQLEKGDVFIAVSNDVVPDGIHSHCYYAVFDVIETVPGSNDPSDLVIKIHNCYHDEPEYIGPLCVGDQDWTPTLRSVCKANPEKEPEFLYLPQPIFLRNFSSMQRCHINCGDRLTVSGEWNESCSGGNPKYTTFRENPMYLVQNTSGRSVTVLAELRHAAPVFYDAHDMGVYHQSALSLLRPDGAAQLVAPLLAHNTHRFVQKGLLTDAREVCAEMELPANSTCYLVPYTKKKGCFGKYQLSVYPQDNPVTLTTLRPIAETHNCMSKDVVVQPGSGTSARVDITVSEPCDIHVLLHQNKVTDPASAKRGDHLAEDEIFMAAYEDNSILVRSSGDASNAREHAIAFQASRAGRYTFLIGCPSKPVTGSAPCTLSVYTPRYAQASFLAVHEATRPRIPGRLGSVSAVASTPKNVPHTLRQPQAPQRPSTASNGAGSGLRNGRSRGYSQ